MGKEQITVVILSYMLMQGKILCNISIQTILLLYIDTG